MCFDTNTGLNKFADILVFYCGEHFLKLVLNCCVSGPKLLRANVNLASAQQFRT